jgi:hypothetical protein
VPSRTGARVRKEIAVGCQKESNDEIKPGGDESPPSGIGPWLGARVAPQHCPILRPGQRKPRQKEFIVAINN